MSAAVDSRSHPQRNYDHPKWLDDWVATGGARLNNCLYCTI
jgi:hypothetical protein